MRELNPDIPLLFMSARDDIGAKREGFSIGIDDYIVKPFDLDELLMRVQALLRRAHIKQDRKLVAGNLTLDADAMTAVVDNNEIQFTTREFNIIYKLLSYPNKTFSRAQLMDEFWGMEMRACVRSMSISQSFAASSLTVRVLKFQRSADWDIRRC